MHLKKGKDDREKQQGKDKLQICWEKQQKKVGVADLHVISSHQALLINICLKFSVSFFLLGGGGVKTKNAK